MRIPLHGLLLTLVILVLLPSVVVTVYSDLQQRRQAVDSAKDEAFRLSRIAARDFQVTIDEGRHLLAALTLIPDVREAGSSQCSPVLAGLLEQHPHYANIAIATPDGDVF